MNKFLTPDNPVMIFITKIVNCVWLNILWFLCSLPVVTAGASTTALFYVTLKMVKNEEGNVTAQFFRAFRDNFKFSTKVWLVMLGLGIVLGIDGYVLYHMRFSNAFWTICTAVFLVAVVAYLIIAMYIFPLMARFENTMRMMFLNSIMIGMRFLLCTALMFVIYFIMAFIIINIFTPAVVFGEGVCAYFCSCLLSRILTLCEPREETEDSAQDGSEDGVPAEGKTASEPEKGSEK